MKRPSFPLAASCLFVVCNLTLSAAAQNNAQPQFRVGDRVTVSPTGLQAAQYWRTCIITSPLQSNAYGVRCDPQHSGQTPDDYNVLPNWVKPLATGDPRAAKPTYETQKKHAAADGTVLADRLFVNCNADQPKKYKNGDSIPPELAKGLIQCLWEKPANPGMDGAVTVDIDSMDIGRPRTWVYQQDMGQGIADLNTRVWPIDVKWTWKTYYRTRTHVIVEEDIFNCYVNAFGKWSCGLGQRVKEISKKDIAVE